MATAGISESISQSMAENPQWTGGEAVGSPEPQSHASPPAAEPSAPETPDADEDRFTDLDPSTLTPDHQQVYKSMQGDYTRAKQAIAEERRRLAALEAQWAEYQQAQLGNGQPQAPDAYAPADPYNQNPYDESPIYGEVQSLKRLVEEEAQARRLQAVQFQIRDLESQIGRPLKEEEIQTTARVMQRNNGLSVEDAYYLAHRKEREAALRRQGAEETLKTLQQARGATPPPSNLSPPPSAGPPPLTNIKSAVNEALESMGIR